jgi:hypothetical protein
MHIGQRVQRPGSHSAEMAELTTQEMLVAYGNVNPSIPALLIG